MIRDSFTFSSGDLGSTTENYKLQHRFHRFSLIRIAGDVQDLVIVQAQLVEGKPVVTRAANFFGGPVVEVEFSPPGSGFPCRSLSMKGYHNQRFRSTKDLVGKPVGVRVTFRWGCSLTF